MKAARRPVFVYQLGDHDPSGVDAWRDFTKKVRAFASGAEVYFCRLAVTPEQIGELSLPTRPTKAATPAPEVSPGDRWRSTRSPHRSCET